MLRMANVMSSYDSAQLFGRSTRLKPAWHYTKSLIFWP